MILAGPRPNHFSYKYAKIGCMCFDLSKMYQLVLMINI